MIFDYQHSVKFRCGSQTFDCPKRARRVAQSKANRRNEVMLIYQEVGPHSFVASYVLPEELGGEG